MTTTTQKVILVVEDHPQNLELVTDLLESAGYRVLTATTAEEGLALTTAHRPDLILMDIRLPGLDGLKATRMLKDDLATRGIPVIALTAYAMPEDRQRIRDAGCEGYLTKPLKLPLLLEQIATYLGPRTSGGRAKRLKNVVPSADNISCMHSEHFSPEDGEGR